MKRFNAIELLELIRHHGRISRSDLAVLSRLSKPTVSDQVDALIASGLVVEVGMGSASARGGKKPTLIELNAAYGRILCADVGSEWIRFLSGDLKGSVLEQTQVPTRPERGKDAIVKTVKRGIAALLARQPARRPGVQTISVALPGVVVVRQGVALETDNVFGWRDLRLGAELAATFKLPVHIDNDVNMAAVAELRFGKQAFNSFALIRLGTGIGAGIVLDGKLHHGAHWAAGEIGHAVLDATTAPHSPTPRGYLESIVGADRVADRLRDIARKSGARLSADLSASDAWTVLHKHAGSNPAIRVLYEQVVRHLGCAVANVASAYDPEAILLLGKPFSLVLHRIQEIVMNLVPWPVEIRLSALGDDASLQGALAAGLTRAYQQIVFSLQAERPEDYSGGRSAALAMASNN
jgi:predicted NBD/HSP70 family sugar kinase